MLTINRRGGYYPLAMIIVVLVGSVWLMVSIHTMYDSVDQKFGVVQSAVLDLSGDMRLVETQLELASKHSMNRALEDLPSNPQIGCDFGDVPFLAGEHSLLCPVVNDPELQSEVCVPDMLSSFSAHFNRHMDKYVRNYRSADVDFPLNSFEVMPFRDFTAVIGTKPVNITMRDKDGFPVGQASFRPAFKTISDPILSNGFPLMVADVKDIATRCHDSENISACIEDVIQPPGTYYQKDGKYLVIYPWSPKPWCFAFNLGAVEI